MTVAIVTGASTGIGRSVAVALGRRKCHVVVVSRSDDDGNRETLAEVEAAGGSGVQITADVGTSSGVARVFAAADGEPRFLINNAGRNVATPFRHWAEGDWDEMYRTNLRSVALMSQRFVTRLESSGGTATGAIVNVSSIRGLDGASTGDTAAYSAAKAGVISLTGALAKELAPSVTVNCVTPGYVRTAYLAQTSREQRRAWLGSVPIARFIEPHEVADAILFLLDHRALTGANLVIDGGWRMAAA
ncbi:SDR family NAD(P)-dependent oxidoreductase [Actinoplanes palleronii]|uniref:Beta-ketoacyl-ACP reductase n=1 Tax=Actinoplanes palleronii TaxID=113570 RepID=A0ABQ4B6J6_9ACTN|nr:SDR family oxidoreductase [Actinoplanes palleronii]GIE66301.1 beta-ketoacyl-ACP reductase [Actinoplanes palleronii]